MTETKTAYNTSLAKVAVQYSADSFVVNQTLIFQLKYFNKGPSLSEQCKTLYSFKHKYLTCFSSQTNSLNCRPPGRLHETQ